MSLFKRFKHNKELKAVKDFLSKYDMITVNTSNPKAIAITGTDRSKEHVLQLTMTTQTVSEAFAEILKRANMVDYEGSPSDREDMN